MEPNVQASTTAHSMRFIFTWCLSGNSRDMSWMIAAFANAKVRRYRIEEAYRLWEMVSSCAFDTLIGPYLDDAADLSIIKQDRTLIKAMIDRYRDCDDFANSKCLCMQTLAGIRRSRATICTRTIAKVRKTSSSPRPLAVARTVNFSNVARTNTTIKNQARIDRIGPWSSCETVANLGPSV